MDTDVSNSINIHMLDGSIMKFNATDNNRLYSHRLNNHHTIDNIWNLLVNSTDDILPPNTSDDHSPMNPKECFNVDTVASRSDEYTRRQVKAAVAARELENIIMRPGNRKCIDICLPHFKGECPVTKLDVKAANDMMGKNLGYLKGKTVHNKQKHVRTNVEPIPPKILNCTRMSLSRLISCSSIGSFPSHYLKKVTCWHS